MSCSDHLQWGYVDQPPLIPFLTHICGVVPEDSLRSIRFIPEPNQSSSARERVSIPGQMSGLI